MSEHAVVIAGGGPAGMMLAAELALAGVDAVVVEQREARVLESSRSGGLQARTLEVLDQRGVGERFVAQGKPGQYIHFPTTLDLSDFPTRRPHGLALWQNRFEEILGGWVDELERAGPARVRGDRLRAGRGRCRRRAGRRAVAAGGLAGRVRRWAQRHPQGGGHRVRWVGRDEQLADRRGQDPRPVRGG